MWVRAWCPSELLEGGDHIEFMFVSSLHPTPTCFISTLCIVGARDIFAELN